MTRITIVIESDSREQSNSLLASIRNAHWPELGGPAREFEGPGSSRASVQLTDTEAPVVTE